MVIDNDDEGDTGVDIGKLPRGEDFAAKFAKGEWAETVLIETIEGEDGLFAFQYGVSRGDALTTKAELDRVKEPGVEELKRPDVLVFSEDEFDDLDGDQRSVVRDYVEAGPDERAEILPELERAEIVGNATVALEAESSEWKSQSFLSAFVKDEDFPRLRAWRDTYDVPIHVCQLFFDEAYIIPFSAYEKHAEDAREGSTSVPGFEHGEIKGIWKDGLIANVDTFPDSKLLGEFEEEPSVVTSTENGVEPCDHSWTSHGKLETGDDVSPFFHGGELHLEKPLIEYI